MEALWIGGEPVNHFQFSVGRFGKRDPNLASQSRTDCHLPERVSSHNPTYEGQHPLRQMSPKAGRLGKRIVTVNRDGKAWAE